jgi:DNA (cytosine-5)-methyltransferase 1
MARIVDEVQPRFVFIENSPMLRTRGLSVVLKDLAEMGFNAEWGCISAAACGAPHDRDRMWILASYSNSPQREGRSISSGVHPENTNISNTRWGKDKPGVDRMADGVAARSHRLTAIGNGQVPRVAASAFHILSRRISNV